MTDFGKLNPWNLWIVHAHANVSGNCVRCIDADTHAFKEIF